MTRSYLLAVVLLSCASRPRAVDRLNQAYTAGDSATIEKMLNDRDDYEDVESSLPKLLVDSLAQKNLPLAHLIVMNGNWYKLARDVLPVCKTTECRIEAVEWILNQRTTFDPLHDALHVSYLCRQSNLPEAVWQHPYLNHKGPGTCAAENPETEYRAKAKRAQDQKALEEAKQQVAALGSLPLVIWQQMLAADPEALKPETPRALQEKLDSQKATIEQKLASSPLSGSVASWASAAFVNTVNATTDRYQQVKLLEKAVDDFNLEALSAFARSAKFDDVWGGFNIGQVLHQAEKKPRAQLSLWWLMAEARPEVFEKIVRESRPTIRMMCSDQRFFEGSNEWHLKGNWSQPYCNWLIALIHQRAPRLDDAYRAELCQAVSNEKIGDAFSSPIEPAAAFQKGSSGTVIYDVTRTSGEIVRKCGAAWVIKLRKGGFKASEKMLTDSAAYATYEKNKALEESVDRYKAAARAKTTAVNNAPRLRELEAKIDANNATIARLQKLAGIQGSAAKGLVGERCDPSGNNCKPEYQGGGESGSSYFLRRDVEEQIRKIEAEQETLKAEYVRLSNE